MPAIPIARPPAGTVACFRTPASNSAYGRLKRSAIRRETCLDLPLELRVDESLEPRSPSQELDGPVVVGRAQSARDHEQVGREPFPDRLLELGRLVPYDRDPRRLQPEPGQLLGEKRPVRVPASAADELASGDEDRRTRRSTGRRGERDAVRRHLEPAARPGARSGHDARPAVELEPQVRRRVDVDPELPADEPLLAPVLECSRVDRLVRPRAAADDEVRAAARRSTRRAARLASWPSLRAAGC